MHGAAGGALSSVLELRVRGWERLCVAEAALGVVLRSSSQGSVMQAFRSQFPSLLLAGNLKSSQKMSRLVHKWED